MQDTLLSDIDKMDLPYPLVFVQTQEELAKAVEELSSESGIAFDSEGVDLGRSGPLTIATFGGLSAHDAPIYVVDVQELGGDVVFPTRIGTTSSLRQMLEDDSISKVTFDCRSDSDALYHQFKVKLSGVLDLQVLDQAVRIHNGEAPPSRNPYLTIGGIPFLPSMDAVAERQDPTTSKMSAPHRRSSKVWSDRPLSSNSIAYAANDVHVIRKIKASLCSVSLPPNLDRAVKEHSQRYERMYRDRKEELDRITEKDFIVEEHALIDASELPQGHPRNPRGSALKAAEKWDNAVAKLRSNDFDNSAALFSDVIFILQHDEWFTDAGFVFIRKLADEYPYFTAKQRNRIANPPKLRKEIDYYDY